MTDGEAAEVLRRLAIQCGDGEPGGGVTQREYLAMERAIEALERPEPSGDLVSLEAVQVAIEQQLDILESGSPSSFDLDGAIRALPRALSVAQAGKRLEGDCVSVTYRRMTRVAATLADAIAALLEEVEADA